MREKTIVRDLSVLCCEVGLAQEVKRYKVIDRPIATFTVMIYQYELN